MEQRLITLFGGKGQVQKVGKIFTETGVTVQEQIAVPALFKPLKFLEVVAGVPSSDFFDLLPEIVLRKRLIVRPLQEEIGGVEHDINSPFLALP